MANQLRNHAEQMVTMIDNSPNLLYSVIDIAEELNVTRQTIYNVLRKFPMTFARSQGAVLVIGPLPSMQSVKKEMKRELFSWRIYYPNKAEQDFINKFRPELSALTAELMKYVELHGDELPYDDSLLFIAKMVMNARRNRMTTESEATLGY